MQNVLIRITKGNEGKTFELNQTQPAILDQKGCLYHPRVIGVRVGQKVEFVNSDEIFHNVRSITTENQKFNMAMPRKNQKEVKIFNKPEIFMQAKCSVHPWMGAYIAIMDHPFFDVSKEDGSFEIKQLPEGKYKIEAWHEIFGKLENDIEIKNQETLNLNFTFKGTP
jgi:plastocyanin